MQTTIQTLRPIKSDDIGKLMEWCSFYDQNGKYPATILERFAIGLYQIQSGMEWKDIANKNEAWCAAFIHFLTLAEKLNLPVEQEIYPGTLDIGFLLFISKAQQDIFYKHNTGKTQRSSRYNPERLTVNLGRILSICYSKVPKEERLQGFYDATSIMLGKL